MLTEEQVAEVKRLLGEGQSHRAIARLLGISRGSVCRISTGRRERALKPPRMTSRWEESVTSSEAVPKRCPACGGLVLMPCGRCMVEAMIAQVGEDRPRLPMRSLVLGLDLKPEHHARYLPFHKARVQGT